MEVKNDMKSAEQFLRDGIKNCKPHEFVALIEQRDCEMFNEGVEAAREACMEHACQTHIESITLSEASKRIIAKKKL